MKIIQQPLKLAIKNMDVRIESNDNEQKHGPLLRNTFRCIVCGPPNCGKTNVVLTIYTSVLLRITIKKFINKIFNTI